MSSITRSQTQVHDGFATIRTRGLCRSRSIRDTEQIDRYRPISLKNEFHYINNNDITFLNQHTKNNIDNNEQQQQQEQQQHHHQQQLLYKKIPNTIQCSTFRPLSEIVLNNDDNNTIKKTSQFSLESLQSSTTTSKTPDYINDDIFTFTSDPIEQYGKIKTRTLSSYSYNELDEDDDDDDRTSLNNTIELQEIHLQEEYKPKKKPLIRSATLQHKRTTPRIRISTTNSIHNDNSNNINDFYINQYDRNNKSILEPKNIKYSYDFYSPTTNYYRPCEIKPNRRTTTSPKIRCSSAEILDNVVVAATDISSIDKFVEKQNYINCDRRYHTLGHPRNGQQRLVKSNLNRQIWNNKTDLTDLTDYIDPLDCKIGCQTTLRSKPIIPWYELAIRKDYKRKSCPPFEAHVVAAFEQSLSNMTQRLQQLTATAERKDSELTDMRQTIELLRKQSIQAGLTTAHMQSMGLQANCQPDSLIRPANSQQQQLIQQHHQSKQQATANGGTNITSGVGGHHHTSGTTTGNGMQRHHSSDSMCSLNSISSGCSAQDKKKKKGWLRSSFTKAFSRNAKISKTNRHVTSTSSNLDQTSISTQQSSNNDSHSNSSALPPPSPTKSPQKTVAIIENAKPVDAIVSEGNHVVEDLKKQLREKDLVLTDIRLEALSSASQLESLKDTVMKMRAEMINLKQNNERLQKLVTSRSLAGSEVSLGNAISPNGSINESRRYSLADGISRPPMDLPKSLEEEVEEENIPPAPAPEPPPPPLSPTTHIDLTPPPPAIEVPSPTHLSSNTVIEDVPDHTDGKKIAIAVYLGQPESFPKYAEEILESDNYYTSSSSKHSDVDDNHENGFQECSNVKTFTNLTLNEFIIAYTYISGKTTWQNLDYIVRKTFKDYVSRIDPGTNLGLNTDSITSYHLGEAKRGPEMGFPELLPCGYIIGNVRTLYICLQGVGSLAFDSLIPRSIVHRYISLLTEHRRLILCGPSGTGKSYLARKLAEFLVARSGRGNPSEAIATFNVDHKSSKELRQYLGHIAEQASMSNGASELPSVIILDNLHHASALGDVFSCLLSAGPAAKLPCIIGTMSQATCNTTNLQLHHNFRWVLTANHMEPVKGFLGRFLKRRQFSLELSTHNLQPELSSVLAWLPTVWQHINRFLENHSSSDVTIGPRLFLSCPLDLKDSQVWFTDVWNHLAPYLVEAVREGVQLYGRRGGTWNDPSEFIRDTYPWPYGPDSVPPLRQINAEDVGLEGGTIGNNDSQDPLLNMLMRLQEAANYSGNQEQESDCASLDSNITPDSSAGAE